MDWSQRWALKFSVFNNKNFYPSVIDSVFFKSQLVLMQ